MWRPDGWKNPYPRQENTKPEFQCTLAYEAGADVMLETLKKEGKRVDSPVLPPGHFSDLVFYYLRTCGVKDKPGWLVFIPEEEE